MVVVLFSVATVVVVVAGDVSGMSLSNSKGECCASISTSKDGCACFIIPRERHRKPRSRTETGDWKE